MHAAIEFMYCLSNQGPIDIHLQVGLSQNGSGPLSEISNTYANLYVVSTNQVSLHS